MPAEWSEHPSLHDPANRLRSFIEEKRPRRNYGGRAQIGWLEVADRALGILEAKGIHGGASVQSVAGFLSVPTIVARARKGAKLVLASEDPRYAALAEAMKLSPEETEQMIDLIVQLQKSSAALKEVLK